MGRMNRREEQSALVARLTQERLAFELRQIAGLTDAAEDKAFAAKQAQAISEFDERHGLSDVSYEDFRAAFDAGMGCEELFVLRNAMHPKDPLKIAANDDLRSVECFHINGTRRRPE